MDFAQSAIQAAMTVIVGLILYFYLRDRFGDLNDRINGGLAEVRADIRDLRQEMVEIRREIADLRSDLLRVALAVGAEHRPQTG